MNVQAGQTVSIQITALPRSEAARKTLVRLFRKDPAVQRHHRRQKAVRPSLERWRRGNKMWHHQMRTEPAVVLALGQSYTVRASVDVIRDLASVSRFVKVAAR